MDRKFISTATISNWQRLGVDGRDLENRLSKRANKRFSAKKFLPVEYLSNSESIPLLQNILGFINSLNLSVSIAIYNLALNLLNWHGFISIEHEKIISNNKFLLDILNSYPDRILDDRLLSLELPYKEGDILGVIYQSLLTEGDKNKKGSYYTPANISGMLAEFLSLDSKFLDPCCGTGSFLLAAANSIDDPNKIFGCDIDGIACFIAKLNLIIRYKGICFNPNIYNTDFLLDNSIFMQNFDVVATNPPWGAITIEQYEKMYPEVLSKESFSYFIVKCYSLLKEEGYAVFVLPESILNVAQHKDIRKFILNNFKINLINVIGKNFSGVLTDSVVVNLCKDNCCDDNLITIVKDNKQYQIFQMAYLKNDNYNFMLISNYDDKLLTKIYSRKFLTLENSLWALGIVTGNNKKHLESIYHDGYEKIYTGKEIQKYKLLPARKFIKYNRKQYQQVASEDIYRAKEKLVYKFISKKLVFAYDDSSSLFLNSANILIPKINNYSVKTVLAFLNSEVFQYIYTKKFDELKILKGNLLQMPFPILSNEQDLEIEVLVDKYIKTGDILHLSRIDDIIYNIFNLDDFEIRYIRSEILNK